MSEEQQAPQETTESVLYPSSDQSESTEQTPGAGEEKPSQEQESAGEGAEATQGNEGDSQEGKDTGEVEYKLELPEGSPLAKEKVEEVKEFAKRHGLSNEAAQEALKAQEAVAQNFVDQMKERHSQTVDAWAQETMSDPDIGGDKLKQSAELAKRALQTFASEKLIEGLRETGYGNHPEVIRVFSKIGELIQDDQLVMPGKQAKQRSAAEILYGTN